VLEQQVADDVQARERAADVPGAGQVDHPERVEAGRRRERADDVERVAAAGSQALDLGRRDERRGRAAGSTDQVTHGRPTGRRP
jgi:hypothetical protein